MEVRICEMDLAFGTDTGGMEGYEEPGDLLLVPGIVNMCMTDVRGHLAAASVGAAMILMSYATRGALGMGDGLFFLLSACFLSFQEELLLFFLGLGLSSVWSMGIVLCAFFAGRDTRSRTIPFLACVWPAGVWLVCR